MTFGALADQLIAEWAKGYKNPKHIRQWSQTIKDHAPNLSSKPIGAIGTDDIPAVLQGSDSSGAPLEEFWTAPWHEA